MRESTPRGAGHPDFGDAPPEPSRGSHGPIRILVADDEREVREALADLINEEPNLQLVGMAGDADEAIELADAARPDVVVLDVAMPKGGGPKAAREIRIRHPGTRLLALSAHEDGASVRAMLGEGAEGYLVKVPRWRTSSRRSTAALRGRPACRRRSPPTW